MEAATVGESLRLAKAAERVGCLHPGGWPDLAVALLLEDAQDPEIAELAGLGRDAGGWSVHGLTAALYARHDVPALDADGAVQALAGLMAADLAARPAAVTGPMIRMLAGLALATDFESALATDCYRAEDFLDCDCDARVDLAFEAELEALPGPPVPDAVIRVLAAPLRASLPLTQPRHGH